MECRDRGRRTGCRRQVIHPNKITLPGQIPAGYFFCNTNAIHNQCIELCYIKVLVLYCIVLQMHCNSIVLCYTHYNVVWVLYCVTSAITLCVCCIVLHRSRISCVTYCNTIDYTYHYQGRMVTGDRRLPDTGDRRPEGGAWSPDTGAK
jgi:hypothetical protein